MTGIPRDPSIILLPNDGPQVVVTCIGSPGGRHEPTFIQLFHRPQFGPHVGPWAGTPSARTRRDPVADDGRETRIVGDQRLHLGCTRCELSLFADRDVVSGWLDRVESEGLEDVSLYLLVQINSTRPTPHK